MASISSNSDGTRRLYYSAPDGERRIIYLGKVPLATARIFKTRVEHLLAAKTQNVPVDLDTSRWLNGLPDPLYKKLVSHGLAEAKASRSLGRFLEDIAARYAKAKPNTKKNVEAGEKKLLEFFDGKRDLRSITADEGDRYGAWLRENSSSSHAGRMVKYARQFFKVAVRARMIDANPFEGVAITMTPDKEREFFVTTDMARQVLEACPSIWWKVLFCLARWGGMRVPSEINLLEWSHVDWAKNRVLVTSPKTEHHEGKDSRWIPLFPELRGGLAEAFEQAEDGAVYVLPAAIRDTTGTNLRNSMQRIIRNAGLSVWPKLFVNCRASRATELQERYPIAAVCSWMGHNALVAQKHYWQSLESYMELAAREDNAESNAPPTQNPTQKVIEHSCTLSGEEAETSVLPVVVQDFAEVCNSKGVGEYARQESNL